jgi:hypothetical protein
MNTDSAEVPQLDLFTPRPSRPPPPVAAPDPPEAPPVAAPASAATEYDRSFEAFHAANPRVYELLVHFARIALAAGRQKIGVRVLWERMRWETWITTTGGEFKLNDHYHSRYARLIMATEPDLADVFRTRELRS